MDILNKLKDMRNEKKLSSAVAVCGIAGLALIMLSSVIPDKKDDIDTSAKEKGIPAAAAESYCSETERRLETFLKGIDGAGEVMVYLNVGSGERYVYAAEERRSESDNRKEVEEKYVMTGNGSGKTALIEKIEQPEVCGAVIAASGCKSPAVCERIYKAASAALDIPINRIYVTTLE